MRYIFIVVLLFAVLILSSVAGASDITFGAKVGVTAANITETPEEWKDDADYSFGFTGGGYLSYAFNRHLSIQPELLYSMKGTEAVLVEDYLDLTVSFDYIEIPVLLRYNLPLEGDFRPFLFGGPCIAYLLESELSISTIILSADADFSSVSHTNDFAMVLGGGFSYRIGERVFTLDARYQRGFTNVIVSGDFDINGDPQTIEADDIKNTNFAIMLGYQF
ncbi:MAG: outer membrane beta-barrel protein [Candidatus Latescibacteria bacterium]|nr:outer membrane beta-barrel protein [bacterium]MBD3424590.1 outer membrane beta-barrel protein [Candidatus Latescibacterota bacterium]